jgi:hypothetical protein
MSVLDHEGNAIQEGSLLYIPVKVTQINSLGGLTVTTGYSNTTLAGVPGPDTHKGQPPSWPALP